MRGECDGEVLMALGQSEHSPSDSEHQCTYLRECECCTIRAQRKDEYVKEKANCILSQNKQSSGAYSESTLIKRVAIKRPRVRCTTELRGVSVKSRDKNRS